MTPGLDLTPAVPPAEESVAAQAREAELPWQRLDKRMLLVHPVQTVIHLAPVLIFAALLGRSSGNHRWALLGLTIVLGLAVSEWFTTTYRIGPVHIEQRSGLFRRRKLSVPRSHIRSIDVESKLLHRVLGLAVIRVDTGQQDGIGAGLRLNALDARAVPPLRSALLGSALPGSTLPGSALRGTAAGAPTSAPIAPAGVEVARFSPAWVRYAPFSMTGPVIVAPIVGLALQYDAANPIAETEAAARGVEFARYIGIPITITLGVVAVLAVVSAAACAGYLLRWGRLRVIDDGETLHCESGVLTTRAVTLDLDRLRGATVSEPLLLRAVGGAELEAIMTGGNRQPKLIPQSPRREVERVMSHLLGSAAQYTAPLVRHGPIAARRRMTRAVVPVLLVAAGVGIARWLDAPIPWAAWLGVALLLVAAVALARDRYRGLGHAVLEHDRRWLITRSGSLYRDRDCVEADGIVGWTVRQTYFQRRAGVARVRAATAAGKGHYDVLDLPVAQAWELIDRVQPGAGDVWQRRT